jgi:hypothetical protein
MFTPGNYDITYSLRGSKAAPGPGTVAVLEIWDTGGTLLGFRFISSPELQNSAYNDYTFSFTLSSSTQLISVVSYFGGDSNDLFIDKLSINKT